VTSIGDVHIDNPSKFSGCATSEGVIMESIMTDPNCPDTEFISSSESCSKLEECVAAAKMITKGRIIVNTLFKMIFLFIIQLDFSQEDLWAVKPNYSLQTLFICQSKKTTIHWYFIFCRKKSQAEMA